MGLGRRGGLGVDHGVFFFLGGLWGCEMEVTVGEVNFVQVWAATLSGPTREAILIQVRGQRNWTSHKKSISLKSRWLRQRMNYKTGCSCSKSGTPLQVQHLDNAKPKNVNPCRY